MEDEDIETFLGESEWIECKRMPLDGDPSIFAPWGRMSYPEGYKSGKCSRPD